MRARILILTLIVLTPLMAFGRIVLAVGLKDLIADSQLVFVGKVKSVKASGISTYLSYPTWEGVSFPWLAVEMEVVAPFKGVRNGDVVHVMMLSIGNSQKAQLMYSPPEVLEPDKDDVFFLCLGPTPITNTFAILTGPYDENLAAISLHRAHEANKHSTRNAGKTTIWDDKRFAPIWHLVNKAGEILPDGVEKLRTTFEAEIRKKPKNAVIYLEWQAHTNAHSWVSDVPKGFSPTNSNARK